MTHQQHHQHCHQKRKKHGKILLPSEEYNNKSDGDDCVEISHLIQKLNSLNSLSSNSFTNKYIHHQIPQLSQSETSSFDVSATYNYVSSTTATADISDTSFQSNSSSQYLHTHPLQSISMSSHTIPINPINPINPNDKQSIIVSNELIEISESGISGDSLDTIYTKTTATDIPRGIDDVLEVFQAISCDVNDDENHNNNNNNNNNNYYQNYNHYQQQSIRNKSITNNNKKNKPKPKLNKYSMTDNKNYYYYEQGYNYSKYTKHKRGNPFSKHIPSK